MPDGNLTPRERGLTAEERDFEAEYLWLRTKLKACLATDLIQAEWFVDPDVTAWFRAKSHSQRKE